MDSTYLTEDQPATNGFLLREKSASLPNELPGDKAIKFNVEDAGYYRVEYDSASWDLLVAQVGRLSEAETEARLERHLAEHWDDICESVGRAMLPAERIRAVLQRAGCPTDPTQIGLSPDFYATAVRDARFLRNRYTFLDLADDSGHRAVMATT